jgi:hypothetical protein
MSEIRPLTGGLVNKGGHNEGPSQITERPPALAAIKPIIARQSFCSAFRFDDRVYIDGDTSIKATVIGFNFRPTGHSVEIAWMSNGTHQSIWAETFRLTLVSE